MAGANRHAAPPVGHRGRRLWNRWTFPVVAVALDSIIAGYTASNGDMAGTIFGLAVAGGLSIFIIRTQASEARDQAEIAALRQRADAAFPQMWGAN